MVSEARLDRVASGLAPVTPGWFVVNTAEAAWVTNDDWCGGVCIFESDDFVLRGRPDLTEYVKPHAGFTIRVVPVGQPSDLYHAESVQEDFLIISGECILIIEEEERHLRTWDFVHCPPMTAHTFVATDDGPCVILATGNRRDDLERIYPRSETALRHGAGSDVTTPDPERHGRWEVRHPKDWTDFPGPTTRRSATVGAKRPEPVCSHAVLVGHPAELLAGIVERDLTEDGDFLGGEWAVRPSQRVSDCGWGLAPVDVRDEVRGDHVVHRERLEPGDCHTNAVGETHDLVGGAAVAPPAGPVGQCRIEHAGCGSGSRVSRMSSSSACSTMGSASH